MDLIRFPEISAEPGMSENEAIRNIAFECGGKFPEFSEILVAVRQYEHSVNCWLTYSANQRSTPNWYFQKRLNKYHVGFLGGEDEGFGVYDDASLACSVFIALQLTPRFVSAQA